jgi:hypothetical protein
MLASSTVLSTAFAAIRKRSAASAKHDVCPVLVVCALVAAVVQTAVARAPAVVTDDATGNRMVCGVLDNGCGVVSPTLPAMV